MVSIVVMLHNTMQQKAIVGMLQRMKIDVIAIPVGYSEKTFEQQLKALEDEIKDEKHISMVIVESNYGKPGDVDINKDLLTALEEKYSPDSIVVNSGTMESLAKALEFNSKIDALPKGDINNCRANIMKILSSSEQENQAERVLDTPALKEKVKELSSPQSSDTNVKKVKPN